jgi:hypothetical protein
VTKACRTQFHISIHVPDYFSSLWYRYVLAVDKKEARGPQAKTQDSWRQCQRSSLRCDYLLCPILLSALESPLSFLPVSSPGHHRSLSSPKGERMKSRLMLLVVLAMGAAGTVSCNKEDGPIREAVSHKDAYQQAYIYGFPMIAAYKAMYQFNVVAQ